MRNIIRSIVPAISLLLAVGCSQNEELTPIRVGASPIPHAEILEVVKPLLREKGYDLQVVEFDEYVLPNKGVESGNLDANYFQHLPYLNLYNEQHETNLVPVTAIHLEPIGVYSKTFASLEEIPNKATVVFSSSIADHGRILDILSDAGLITLKETATRFNASLEDIATNPKELVFKIDVDPGLLYSFYNSEPNSIVVINTNFALTGGLNPLEDAIFLESTEDNPFANFLVTLPALENDPKIIALKEALLSETVRNFILTEYKGSVIPVEVE